MKKRILVVVDMQHDFINGTLGSKDAESIVPAVVEKIKSYNEKHNVVYYTLDSHFDSYENTLEGQKLPVRHCIYGTEGYELDERIEKALSDLNIIATPINKITFGSQNLPRLISEEIIFSKNKYPTEPITYEIELCGLCTDICVVSNALLLRANFPNIKITVDAKCCAGVTLEKHKAALEVMKSCQIDIINE